jgi:tetratricopeptide (TPR) repeat protein
MTEETLFQEALSRPPEERAGFLAQASVGRPDLLAAALALLAAHDKPGNILDRPVAKLGQAGQVVTGEHNPDPTAASPQVTSTDCRPEPEAGAVIAGRYTLIDKIGEGGMGEVWVARQTEPVKRKVALKLIKTGMDSKAVLSRFEQERQALALMDHPNIARVLDGGLTPTGQPFFAMELVNGLPLTRFCDEARLTPWQRLELFVPICQAVQHAHQKGIIHRDLKPANVLVMLLDGKPVPKVIDFGVAKATAGKLTDESLSTQFGAVIGTLDYMSPEQAGFTGVDIDTRADIYSLGVILYELLTGLKPVDARRQAQAGLVDVVRIIKEVEPSKPSTRLSTEESLPALAAARQTEPRKLMAMLRGELDWVVMKCLEKQRERRYETANDLARDLQRYLADETVEARPPSTGYRLRKFLRRNKGPVAAAGLLLLALLAGIAGTTWGLFAAWDQKDRAEAARDNEARQRGYAEAITQFVKDDFLALTSVEGQGRFGGEWLTRNATLRELLDRAARKLNARKDLAPRTEAELCWIIGVSYRGVGEAAQALPFLERSVALNRQTSGPDSETTVGARGSLGVAYRAAGQYDRAVRLTEETLTLSRARFGPDHPLTLHSMNNLALAYEAAGRPDLAPPLLEETLKLQKAKLGPEHPRTLVTMNNLAGAYGAAGRPDLALPLFEEALKLSKTKLGPENPYTLTTMHNLAGAYRRAGKTDLALPLCKAALKLRKAKLGPEHPDTLLSMNGLAVAYLEGGNLALAVPLFEETLKIRKARLGPDHPATLVSMDNLATGYLRGGKWALALPLLEETLKLQKAKLGPGHPDTLTTMSNLATAYRDARKLDLAVPLLEKTVQRSQARLGPDHPNTLECMNNLAAAYWSQKQLDKSIPLFEETLKRVEQKFGRDHLKTLQTLANLGVNYRDAGRLKEALPLLEEAYRGCRKHPTQSWVGRALRDAYARAGENSKLASLLAEELPAARKALPADSPQLAGLLGQIGLGLLEQKKWAEAEPLLRECLAIREKKEPDDWRTFNTQSMLGGALRCQKKYADAEPLLLKGYEGMMKRQAKIPPPGKIRIQEALERLALLYEATGKKEVAARWRRQLETIRAAQKKADAKP